MNYFQFCVLSLFINMKANLSHSILIFYLSDFVARVGSFLTNYHSSSNWPSWCQLLDFFFSNCSNSNDCLSLTTGTLLYHSQEEPLVLIFLKLSLQQFLMMTHYLMICWVLCWPAECYPSFTTLEQYSSISHKHKGLFDRPAWDLAWSKDSCMSQGMELVLLIKP